MGHNRNHDLVQSDEHYTPKILFDALNLRFDLDVCAPENGVPWIPANKSYSIKDDGLSQNWQGLIWLNPPYSKPSPWVDKFIQHNNGIALCVVSRSIWFMNLWNAADAIVPFPRTWKFERPDGSSKAVSFQCFLFGLGQEASQALKAIPEYKLR